MSYATQSDLQALLAPEELTMLTDDATAGTPDATLIAAALAAASALIDQQLAARYLTPVDPAPGVLAMWCAALAAESLWQRHGAVVPRAVADSATLARRALESIHDGLANLAGATPQPDALLCELTPESDATFTFDSLEPF